MISILIATAIAATPVARADTIVVGHPALRGVMLTPRTDTTEVYVTQNGTRRLVSTSVQTVSRVPEGYLVVQVGRGRNGISIDSTTLSAATFAPIRHVEAMPDRRSTFTFANGGLTGPLTDSTGTHAIDERVPVNRFDFSTIGEIANHLPFAAGYEAVIVAYDVFTLKDRTVTVSVSGRETRSWKGREIDAWKTVTDFGTHRVTRWVDPESRRDLRWEISMQGMLMEGTLKD